MHGVGVGGFAEPSRVIDCGNSGTGVRLIMGAMATSPITATFTGDASLVKRPMGRVTDPLALFGARSYGRAGGRLPMTVVGAREPVPVRYTVPGAVGAGEVGGAPRRAERAGRDRGDRARGDAGPYRADARGFRRDDLDRGDARGPRHPPHRPPGVQPAGHRGAVRSVLRRVPRLRGAHRRRLRGRREEHRPEPDADGPFHHARRDGRRPDAREPARRGGRAGGRHPRPVLARDEGDRGAARARARR